jgi:hypothetical protein
LYPDLCGDKSVTYSINSLPTFDLTGGNNEPTSFSPKASGNKLGKFAAIQKIYLTKYPDVFLEIPFYVTILTSVQPVIPDQ